MAKFITGVAQTGGVEKMTIARHPAVTAQEAGALAFFFDLDTKANASQFLSQDLQTGQRIGGAEQIFDDKKETNCGATPSPGISLLHGHPWLGMLDDDDGIHSAQAALRSKIRVLPFDDVIFDNRG